MESDLLLILFDPGRIKSEERFVLAGGRENKACWVFLCSSFAGFRFNIWQFRVAFLRGGGNVVLLRIQKKRKYSTMGRIILVYSIV